MAVEPQFNELIHAPLRLRICSLLWSVKEIDFSVLRDALDINDANLSKHLKVLADAGFVTMSKTASPARNDSRRLTWVKLTRPGQRAFDAHLEALRMITSGQPAVTESGRHEPTGMPAVPAPVIP